VVKAKCHPDRKNAAFGLCKPCYDKKRFGPTRRDKLGIAKTDCVQCGKPKHRRKNGKLSTYCRPCMNIHDRIWAKRHPDRWRAHQRNARFKREFGINLEQFNSMVAAQENRCAICLCELSTLVELSANKAHVDHDHRTLKVRGILCTMCNWLLGQARENEDTLLAAITYLRKHRG
jgi:hypothetical protein